MSAEGTDASPEPLLDCADRALYRAGLTRVAVPAGERRWDSGPPGTPTGV